MEDRVSRDLSSASRAGVVMREAIMAVRTKQEMKVKRSAVEKTKLHGDPLFWESEA